jgi:hypothetical protein
MRELGVQRASVTGAAMVSLLLAAASARANAAMPTGYDVVVQGNTVVICPQNFQKRACPDADGMLREDAATGEVAMLSQFCSASNQNCYVDECVPKGSFRYGFAKPYACCAACAGTSYFDTAEVTTDPGTSCALSTGNDGATAFTGSLPWQDEQLICSYQSPNVGGASGSSGASGSAGSGTGGSAGAPSSGSGSDDDGGCSTRAFRGVNGLVLTVNGALLGLALLALRRRRFRP